MGAGKKVLTPYHVVSAGDLSASFNSAATNLQYVDRVSYDMNWTGSAVGTIYVQGTTNGTNWANLDINAVVLNNATDLAVADIQTTGLVQVRLAYTRTSGTGTINAYVSYKES